MVCLPRRFYYCIINYKTIIMLQGTTTFICSKCKHKFVAPDVEYKGSVLTAPRPCPKCGSRRTCPSSQVDSMKSAYEVIWGKD